MSGSAIHQCDSYQFRLSHRVTYSFLSVCNCDLGLWSIATGMCDMKIAKPASESLPHPTCPNALCEGFALISFIKHSFTWNMGLFWLYHLLFIRLWWNSLDPIHTIMECKTGNPPLLTKAIILLNVFHLLSSVTQKPYKWHIIRFHLFWAFAFIFINVSEWTRKQHNRLSVRLCFVDLTKDIIKYIITFFLASQKNSFHSKKTKKGVSPNGSTFATHLIKELVFIWLSQTNY